MLASDVYFTRVSTTVRGMRAFGSFAAVVVLLLTGCGKDDVDTNPGKGKDIPGDVNEDKGDGY